MQGRDPSVGELKGKVPLNVKLPPARASEGARFAADDAFLLPALWRNATQRIRELVGEPNYAAWLEPLDVRLETTEIRLCARDRVSRITIERHFLTTVRNALASAGYSGEVRLTEASTSPAPDVAPPAEVGGGELGCTDQEDALDDTPPDVFADAPLSRPLAPEYTFATFVVGESNRFACDAARLVADLPGRAYNPLYLHGGVGLGKTHLATAIAAAVRARIGDASVINLSADQFAWICSARTPGEREALRDTLVQSQLLVVDDIQFLARDDGAQEEFFAIFEALIGAGRQVVLTCDQPPPAIPYLAMRLKSRFEAGLAAEIRPPDAALRRAIVARKAELAGQPISREVAELIADLEQKSVRALEGALNRARVFASLARLDLTLATACKALLGRLRRDTPRVGMDEIVGAVADAFAINVRTLRSRRRDRQTVLARQVAIYLARCHSRLQLGQIAADLGCNDHSAAAHAYAAITGRLHKERALAERVARIERRLGVAPTDFPAASRTVGRAG
jgi:chromosomal replication initiator protein